MRICDRRSLLALLVAGALPPAPVFAREPAIAHLVGSVRQRSRRRLLAAVDRAEKGLLALDVVFRDGELGEVTDADPVDGTKARDIAVYSDDDPSGRSLTTHLIVVGGWRDVDVEHTAVRGLFEVRTTELRRAYVHYELKCISDDPRPTEPKRTFVKTDLK
ncbi:MAG: hypothetical protein ABTQ29_09650 [Siculibacillus sp.]